MMLELVFWMTLELPFFNVFLLEVSLYLFNSYFSKPALFAGR